MQKAYNRTYWENKPSDKSPIDQRNLNNIELGVDTIDDRVITLDTIKFDKTEAQGLIKGLTLNPSNGVFAITYYNGATTTIDTLLEKLAVNFDFDEATQRMIIFLSDGTEKYVDLSAFITPIEFIDSGTVAWQLLENGKVTAIVKEGSIEEKHLQPNYLADIKIESGKTQASAQNAAQSANEADYNAKLAQSYAVGGSGIRDNEDTDNAKKYSEQSWANAGTAKEYLTKVEKAAEDALKAVEDALGEEMPKFIYDFETGILYCESTRFVFSVNNGILYWGVAA